MNHKELGDLGEIRAAEFLRKKGYDIQHSNFRDRRGEIDIIAFSPQRVLVFIEVKSCSTSQNGDPSQKVTPKKIAQIQTTAQRYCSKFKIEDIEMRFDVMSVEFQYSPAKITHYENAFIPNSKNYW